jgi:putative chitinase
MTIYDRTLFFDAVRSSLFSGRLTQQQVDGMNFKLDVWQAHHDGKDRRWLAYGLATSMHETASTMWPVEEYGKGSGQPYGKVNAETGFAYFGRGDVQLTWDYNYKNATMRLSLSGDNDLYWHPDKALDAKISADVMFLGMQQGWFRPGNNLDTYFSSSVDDAYNAREIINGDKKIVPSWSNGVSIGNLIKGYHGKFLSALNTSAMETPPAPIDEDLVITMEIPDGIRVIINGQTFMVT